MVGRIPRI